MTRRSKKQGIIVRNRAKGDFELCLKVFMKDYRSLEFYKNLR